MTPERFTKLKQVLARRQPDLTVLADGVHKPHNVSAILRSCDAAGVYRMHAVSAEASVRRHHMMAGGSKRWVEIETHADSEAASRHLRDRGWRLAVADSGDGTVDFRQVDYTLKTAIVVGAELHGPSEHLLSEADVKIKIPMQGMVESLNVSVATAVVLFEAERQRSEAGFYDRSRLSPDEFRRTLFQWAYPEIADRCRKRSLPYPPLSDDGELIENPFKSETD